MGPSGEMEMNKGLEHRKILHELLGCGLSTVGEYVQAVQFNKTQYT